MTKFRPPKKIFHVYHTEGIEYVSYAFREDCDRSTFDGKSLASKWKPILVERVKEDEGRKRIPGDFPSSNVGDLVLNRRAKEKIGSFLEQYGELLPLACDDGEFWTFNVTYFLDALDEKSSTVVRAPDEDRVLMVLKYAFRPEALENAVIFKIPQLRRSWFFVTDSFVELIQSSGLTGLKFKQIWAPN